VIGDGHTVVLGNKLVKRLAKITIDGGALRLINGAGLNVETILMTRFGTLLSGTATTPAEDVDIEFIDTGAIGTEDPRWTKRGLISEGRVEIYGQPKAPFVRLMAHNGALQGATQLELEGTPQNWQVGDQIVIPATRFRRNEASENELRTIAAIGGATITLNAPLTFNHAVSATMRLPIGNLTRSMRFKSENAATNRRGHVRFQLAEQDATPRTTIVRYVRCENLGRTDKAVVLTAEGGSNMTGRYPLHCHHLRTGTPSQKLIGNVVVGSPGWGIVNHSSNAEIEDNIVYDVVGAGFVSELGDEIGTFKRNLAVGMTGIADPNGSGKLYERDRTYLDTPDDDRIEAGDFGFEGVGFWFQGPLVEVEGNVAAGCHGPCYFYHPLGIGHQGVPVGVPQARAEAELGLSLDCPETPGARSRRYWRPLGVDQLVPAELPLKWFRDNEGYGSFIGLKIRFLQNSNTLLYQQIPFPPPGGPTLRDEVKKPQCWNLNIYLPYEGRNGAFWNCETGVMTSYTAEGTIRAFFIGCNDPVVTDPLLPDPSPTETWIGIICNRQNARDMTIVNSRVNGYPVGLLARYENPAWPTVINPTLTNCMHPIVYFDPDPSHDPEDAYPADETDPGPN
jgi:hypothetical protein